jgi:hypothetical protein
MGGRVRAGKIECSRVQNVRGLVGIVELVEAIECSWKQLQECQVSRKPSAATIDEYSSINKGKVCRYGYEECANRVLVLYWEEPGYRDNKGRRKRTGKIIGYWSRKSR